ncbi:hypothetical protein CB1_000306039 [Camelus ferus]|nr:hypothetical protein CB1_000306039 [Camelus ferus]
MQIPGLRGMKTQELPLSLEADALLCHDDELEGRRIAFILYLVPPWDRSLGGTLDLYSVDGFSSDVNSWGSLAAVGSVLALPWPRSVSPGPQPQQQQHGKGQARALQSANTYGEANPAFLKSGQTAGQTILVFESVFISEGCVGLPSDGGAMLSPPPLCGESLSRRRQAMRVVVDLGDGWPFGTLRMGDRRGKGDLLACAMSPVSSCGP